MRVLAVLLALLPMAAWAGPAGPLGPARETPELKAVHKEIAEQEAKLADLRLKALRLMAGQRRAEAEAARKQNRPEEAKLAQEEAAAMERDAKRLGESFALRARVREALLRGDRAEAEKLGKKAMDLERRGRGENLGRMLDMHLARLKALRAALASSLGRLQDDPKAAKRREACRGALETVDGMLADTQAIREADKAGRREGLAKRLAGVEQKKRRLEGFMGDLEPEDLGLPKGAMPPAPMPQGGFMGGPGMEGFGGMPGPMEGDMEAGNAH